MNPYEPPENDAGSDKLPEPRFIIVCGELVIVAGMAGGLIGAVLPAIERARRHRGELPLVPGLLRLSEYSALHFSLIAAFVFALSAGILFALIRTLASPVVVRHFPWWQDRPYFFKRNQTKVPRQP